MLSGYGGIPNAGGIKGPKPGKVCIPGKSINGINHSNLKVWFWLQFTFLFCLCDVFIMLGYGGLPAGYGQRPGGKNTKLTFHTSCQVTLRTKNGIYNRY